jgi:multidrug efflux pump subunit AcrB
MNILAFPVRRFQFTVVVFVMLVALGVTSWMSIPRGEDPPLDFPTFTVVVVFPGAGPADLERLVVRDVEDRLHTLEKVDLIRSRIVDGLATITVEFDPSEVADERYDEVLREVDGLRPTLPDGIRRLSVERASTLDVAIAQIALVAPSLPYAELDRLAERLEDRLTAVPGVREAARWGIPERRVEVGLDPARLAQLGIPPLQVVGALAEASRDTPSGAIEVGERRFTVRGTGGLTSLDQVAGTMVRGTGSALVTVADLGQVRWGYADSTHLARYNGERAAFVTVTQQEGQNIARVRDRVWEALDTFEAELPSGVRMERGFDQARNVSERLSGLGWDFALALGIVLLTLLPLGLRAAGVVMISIPLSLAMGITLLYWAGFTINQLSIVGAVIALGLVVDDAIVVVENVSRFLRQGYDRATAAIEGTRQIAVAAIGSTTTLIFAFLPLLFLPGGPGQYIRSLPLTVVLTVGSSLLVGLLIVPWLASVLLPRSTPAEGNRLLRVVDRGIRKGYAPILDRALRYPGRALGVAGLMVAASLALIPAVGFSLFPAAETPQFYVNITAPEGASSRVTREAALAAEGILLARPEVQGVFTSVGRDNPQMYYNVIPRRESPSTGQLFVILERFDPGRTPALLDELRVELAAWPGARLELREFENGPPIDAPIALRVRGPELETLRRLAGEVEGVLRTTPGTHDVTNPVRIPRTDLRVETDPGKAGILGISAAEVDRTLRLGLEGLSAGTLREANGTGGDDPGGGGRAREVVVRLAGIPAPAPPEVLDRLQVAGPGGALTPLSQLATSRLERTTPEIQRVDRERSVTVTSYVERGFLTDRVTRQALDEVGRLELPPGYRIVAAGEVESRAESFGGIGTAVVIAAFMMLAILVLEFGNFRSTLIVAAEIPLGIMGGILALWLTGNSLSFIAMIGFVALLGIEIKTSILLVDFTNRLRREGRPLRDAILEAGEIRFLPILLTMATAVGCLLPLAIGGEALFSPLAWVLIGGLITSTFLGRVITPVVYSLLPPSLDPHPQPGTSHA